MSNDSSPGLIRCAECSRTFSVQPTVPWICCRVLVAKLTAEDRVQCSCPRTRRNWNTLHAHLWRSILPGLSRQGKRKSILRNGSDRSSERIFRHSTDRNLRFPEIFHFFWKKIVITDWGQKVNFRSFSYPKGSDTEDRHVSNETSYLRAAISTYTCWVGSSELLCQQGNSREWSVVHESDSVRLSLGFGLVSGNAEGTANPIKVWAIIARAVRPRKTNRYFPVRSAKAPNSGGPAKQTNGRTAWRIAISVLVIPNERIWSVINGYNEFMAEITHFEAFCSYSASNLLGRTYCKIYSI